MATTVGQTAADFLAANVGLGTATIGAMMVCASIAVLAVQLRVRRHVPWQY